MMTRQNRVAWVGVRFLFLFIAANALLGQERRSEDISPSDLTFVPEVEEMTDGQRIESGSI